MRHLLPPALCVAAAWSAGCAESPEAAPELTAAPDLTAELLGEQCLVRLRPDVLGVADEFGTSLDPYVTFSREEGRETTTLRGQQDALVGTLTAANDRWLKLELGSQAILVARECVLFIERVEPGGSLFTR